MHLFRNGLQTTIATRPLKDDQLFEVIIHASSYAGLIRHVNFLVNVNKSTKMEMDWNAILLKKISWPTEEEKRIPYAERKTIDRPEYYIILASQYI